jgi:hypothetical protein
MADFTEETEGFHAKILMKEPPLAREAVSGENLLDRKVH